jgi:serine/threonine protein kinase/tetratricopeptide (TPR) repeat protein
MTADVERWRRIEQILDDALDVPPAERPALLDARCAGDADLRAAVARMLAACERADAHFETPVLSAADVVDDAPAGGGRDQFQPGDRVGAYRVTGLLGRGGMGAVYRAERADGAFDREVALKVIKRGMDTDEIVARFRRERQILARLQHPNIASLLDGGVTESGLPYFVMELVEGRPVDVWCDEHRLDVDTRLRLFLTVCDAVRYAHGALVVHRDLKPGNILVRDGEPMLLDFGIAKVLEAEDADQATRVLERRLTPEYAAPEQVRGEPTTTATDVYALGVILYELLTGELPVRVGGSFAEIERTVGGVEPRAPSARVTRDDTTGTAAERAAWRGASPPALRQRLRGDLDAIVLRALAKDPSRRYPSVEALAEDIGRHLAGRPVLARPDSRWYRVSKFVGRNRTVVALTGLAALGLVGGSVATTVFALAADRERHRRQLEAERATAARDFVVNLFAELDPDRLQGRTTFTRDELIDLGARNLDDLESQPELLASVLNTLGQVAFNLGDRDRAEAFFRRALALLETRPDQPERAASLMGIGEVLRLRFRFEDAERHLADALEVRRATLDAKDPAIAESVAALAFAYYNQGRLDDAERLYRQVLAFPGRTPPRLRAAVVEGLADVELRRGNLDASAALYDEALAEYGRLLGPEHPRLALTLWGVGHVMEGRARAALPDTQAVEAHLDRAEQAYRQALGLQLGSYGAAHPLVASTRYGLGRLLTRRARLTEAETELREAIRSFEAAGGAGHPSAGDAWAELARLELALGRDAAAEAAARRALDVYARNDTTEDAGRLRLAAARNLLGRALLAQRRAVEAEAPLRWALAAFEGRPDRAADFRETAAALAELFTRLGQPDSARAYAARAGPA